MLRDYQELQHPSGHTCRIANGWIVVFLRIMAKKSRWARGMKNSNLASVSVSFLEVISMPRAASMAGVREPMAPEGPASHLGSSFSTRQNSKTSLVMGPSSQPGALWSLPP